jgi:hypothetical protein
MRRGPFWHLARGDQQSRRSLRKASTSSLTSAAVLDRGWQKVGWESGRKRGDDEGEEAEDAERVRPGYGGDGEEADPVLVVDASIMPDVPSANTHVPVVMIAERLADSLQAELRR